MSLSDKIHWITGKPDKKLLMIRKEDVKEFIRECKEQIMLKGRRFNIDELAGKELANG